MKSLVNFIKDNKYHIRNIYLELDEELNRIIQDKNGHSNFRKIGQDDPNYKLSNNVGGIPNSKIRKIFNLVDNIIADNLEIEKLHTKDTIGIVLQEGKESILIICKIASFNNQSKDYDIFLKTVGRRNYMQKIKDVKLGIIIKGSYKQILWDI